MRRRKGRPVDGVLLMNKPAGMTSNQALQQAKRLFFAEKAGHTGSLDPMATGVLPLCFGEATKFSQFLLDADKAYRTTVRLGVTTDTCDAEGDEIERRTAQLITQSQVEKFLDNFRGSIQQVPPMYSALKRDGQPLYKLARQGLEVEREARNVEIFELDLLDFRAGEIAEVDLFVRCSKGTYIRSLAHDLGQLLGCGGHVSRLHRVASGEFTEHQCITLETLHSVFEQGSYDALDQHLQPADAPVASLPSVILPPDSAWYFRQGNPVMHAQIYRIADQGDIVRVFCAETDQSAQRFLGLGEITDDGRVAPKRIIANPVI